MNNAMIAIDIGASSCRHMLGQVKNGRLELTELYRFSNGARILDILRQLQSVREDMRRAKG